jgi:hypothetical protein
MPGGLAEEAGGTADLSAEGTGKRKKTAGKLDGRCLRRHQSSGV